MLKKLLIVTPLLALGNGLVQAQIVLGKNEIGVNIGAFVYQGDLSPKAIGSVKTAKPMLGLYYTRILDPFWSVRANLAIGKLHGDDSRFSSPAYMQYRNFNFKTNVVELSALASFNIFGNNLDHSYVKLSPYVFGGAGLAFVSVKRDWSRTNFSYFHTDAKLLDGIAVDTVQSMPKALPVIPLGIGLKYAVLPRLSLVLEGTYRYSFSDYIDGFKYAANPKLKDSYYSVSVGVSFNFGKDKMACPRY